MSYTIKYPAKKWEIIFNNENLEIMSQADPSWTHYMEYTEEYNGASFPDKIVLVFSTPEAAAQVALEMKV